VVKQIAICLAVALALSTITVSIVLWGFLPAVNCAAAGATIVVVMARQVIARDARVRRLVVAAYEAGAAPAQLADVVRVLGTPDVVQARTDHLRREAEVLAKRYTNGDASDY